MAVRELSKAHQELSLEVWLLMTYSARDGSSTVVVLHKGHFLDE